MSAEAAGSVGVEVPASCANLGPGFDCLAAAVDLRLVAWTAPRAAERVTSEGAGADELPTDERNLVWRSFAGYCERFGADLPDVSLVVRSEIPLERGLGSSAAGAVAGLALAREVTGAGGSDHELIELAAALEGHPDNAAAAMLGGVVVCVGGRARGFEPGAGLRPLVCVPKRRQSTEAARGILPERVALGDAAANGGRAALLLAGLTGACAFEPGSMVDVLHEPARFEAMPETGRLVADLRAEGFGACLSGAGPSVLVVVAERGDGPPERVAELAGPQWEVRGLAWDRGGAWVRPAVVSE